MVEIWYNNSHVFSGVCPTPILGRTIETISAGNRIYQLHNISLRGQITGTRCLNLFSDIVTKQNRILSGFSSDFKTLAVMEDGNTVLSFANTQVDSITFDTSKYVGILPFVINLKAYPQNYFSGTYGISNPSDEISYSEGIDGIITISHRVSCQGLNTSSSASNALQNAKNWVAGRTGSYSTVLPHFINYSNSSACLFDVSESIDRLNARYQVNETYIHDVHGVANSSILRHTTEYDFNVDNGISTVRLNGNIEGCKNGAIETLRTRYSSFDAFNEAINQFRRITNRSDLNSTPIAKGVAEDTSLRKLSFSYIYNDDSRPITFFDYRVSFNFDYENETIGASIDGIVSSRETIANRYLKVKEVASQINLLSIIQPLYLDYVNSVAPHLINYPLNPNPISARKSENEFEATIGLGASYSNAPLLPSGIKALEYQMEFSPAINKFVPTPVLDGDGQYIVYNMDYLRRARFSVNIRAVGDDNFNQDQVESVVKNQILALKAQYFNGKRQNLDQQKINKTNDVFSKVVSAQASFSAEQIEFTFS